MPCTAYDVHFSIAKCFSQTIRIDVVAITLFDDQLEIIDNFEHFGVLFLLEVGLEEEIIS